eukprot:COSAG05_NODE_2067_length_3615_cov_14.420032_1_plen_39_part_00
MEQVPRILAALDLPSDAWQQVRARKLKGQELVHHFHRR